MLSSRLEDKTNNPRKAHVTLDSVGATTCRIGDVYNVGPYR